MLSCMQYSPLLLPFTLLLLPNPRDLCRFVYPAFVTIFQEYLNSPKSVTWSAVPITPAQLVAWEEKLGQQPQRGR